MQEHLIGPAREHVPVPAMVDDVARDTVNAMRIPQDVISYTVAPDLPLGVADTTQLSRAFGYILKNALEATENVAAPHINVAVDVAEEKGKLYVVTCISDNGPGIPEAELDKIWVSFYTTKGAKHAGLGLSACLQILKQLDGKVLGGTLPEGGAAFEVWVPVAPPGPDSAAKLPTGKRFLLVDDADAWSRFVAQMLIGSQNTVSLASGSDVDFADFDAILVDEVLEAADSTAILKQIARAGAAAKTLVVSSSMRVERTMALLRLGVRDVVLKPYTKSALADCLG